MSTSILIVEDDRKIATLVAKNLEAAGFVCHQVHDGELALAAVREHDPALLVLDVMLPHLDGLEITRRLREKSNVAILLLTARGGESDKILGFELGADDYLTKPFSPRELVARVRALLRRTAAGSEPDEVFRRGDFRFDRARRRVERAGELIELTSLEFDLLVFLARKPGRVYTRDALLAQVWGEDRVVDSRSIDSLISRLRRKIERDPSRPEHVQTVWGAGYRFSEVGGEDEHRPLPAGADGGEDESFRLPRDTDGGE